MDGVRTAVLDADGHAVLRAAHALVRLERSVELRRLLQRLAEADWQAGIRNRKRVSTNEHNNGGRAQRTHFR